MTFIPAVMEDHAAELSDALAAAVAGVQKHTEAVEAACAQYRSQVEATLAAQRADLEKRQAAVEAAEADIEGQLQAGRDRLAADRKALEDEKASMADVCGMPQPVRGSVRCNALSPLPDDVWTFLSRRGSACFPADNQHPLRVAGAEVSERKGDAQHRWDLSLHSSQHAAVRWRGLIVSHNVQRLPPHGG